MGTGTRQAQSSGRRARPPGSQISRHSRTPGPRRRRLSTPPSPARSGLVAGGGLSYFMIGLVLLARLRDNGVHARKAF
jgi:hypothetical protein